VGQPSTPRSKLAKTTRNTGSPGPSPAGHGVDLEAGVMVGDYRIERKLGHGGMGSVYEAIHPLIEKRVAIKVLKLELSKNDEARDRFVQEARAVNRIRHHGIVDVFGYGTIDDGRCYLVMEMLDGESLGARIDYDPPAIVEACDILIAITHALDAAHGSGIVHRDLKPDNVFLVDNKVKLLDFGIAKLTAPEARSADYTQPGQAMGTPRYIAPEQARGDAVDGRTDIYSLGVMAFELLAGRAPFVSDNAMELIAMHIAVPPPRPSDIEAKLPDIADTLLLRMLDKDPVNRPSLAQVRESFEEIKAPWVTSVTSIRKVVTPPVGVEQLPAEPRIRTPLPTTQIERRTRMIPALAAIGVIALAAAISFTIVMVVKSNSDSPAPPPADVVEEPPPKESPPNVESQPAVAPQAVAPQVDPKPVEPPSAPPILPKAEIAKPRQQPKRPAQPTQPSTMKTVTPEQPKVEPPKVEPPKVEPPKVEPPKPDKPVDVQKTELKRPKFLPPTNP
jgi:serine/threonine protein kinase